MIVNWEDVRYFVTAARVGSFAKAGKVLRVEHTTVGRRVSALEDELGARLLERTRRGLVLTPAGEQLIGRAERAEASMGEIERLAGTFDADEHGEVVLATSSVLAAGLVVPTLERFAQAHPAIQLRMSIGRRYTDLRGRDADLALRLRPKGVPAAEDAVVAVKLGDAKFGLYAAESYLARHPSFSLGQAHDVIRYGDDLPWEPGRAWVEANITTRRRLVIEEMTTVRDACQGGLGVAVLPQFYAGLTLRRLRRDVDAATVFVAVHPDLQRVPRVRVVMDWLRVNVAERITTVDTD